MKKIVKIGVVLALIVICAAFFAWWRIAGGPTGSEFDDPINAGKNRVEITFDFGRQGGMASNQFAVWIADAEGGMVKTVAVTNFTARRGGWKSRKESLPQWVADSGVAAMEQAEIDAVSRATPGSREVCYAWYRDDASGRPVPPGKYTVNVEASLRWENRVLYKAEIDLGGEGAKARPAAEFVGSSTAERGMLTNVVVRSIP